MEEAPYPSMITYMSISQHFNPVVYSTGVNKEAIVPTLLYFYKA